MPWRGISKGKKRSKRNRIRHRGKFKKIGGQKRRFPKDLAFSTKGGVRPVHLESRSVPSHNSFWPDENQRLFQTTPELSMQHADQSINGNDLRLWAVPSQNRQLLTKRKALQHRVAVRTKRSTRSAIRSLGRRSIGPVLHGKRQVERLQYMHDSKEDRYFGEAQGKVQIL
jgi:hypothetical protein